MAGVSIDRNLLEAQMKLRGIKLKDLAAVQKPRPWSSTTSYRKMNGERAFTAPEIQACVKLLGLDADTACKIFFADSLS